MDDHYVMDDLRQYITARPNFFPPPPPPDLLSNHRGSFQPHPYDMLVFRPDSNTSTPTSAARPVNTNIAGCVSSSTAPAAGGACYGGFENTLNCGGSGGGGIDGGAGRWPRQETLTLLEIRSRLDPKFKEANQKSPLWDEVSRIMSEEHGYQRSGKKCREKFENLYKYYKKTKEGKTGRQDGKHYRFFRQLEALYGETNNNNNNNNNNSSASASEAHHHHHQHHHPNHPHIDTTTFHYNLPNKESFHCTPKLSDNTSLSLSNYSEGDTSSSDDTNDLPNEGTDENKRRSGRTGWKAKIKDLVDSQMTKLMEKQEAWMARMAAAVEHKERERMMREEEWRQQDAARIEREHKFWAGERAWIESRDAALMEAVNKLTGKELMDLRSLGGGHQDDSNDSEAPTHSIWPENEISRVVQVKTGMEDDGRSFEQQIIRSSGSSENVLWEEMGNKMSCFGHDRNEGVICNKDKWDSVNNYILKCNKKRRENTKSCNYNQISSQGGEEGGVYCDNNSEQGVEPSMRLSDQNNSSPNNNNNNGISDQSCFRYFMGDGYGRIVD
ncbi:hypothetical protein OROGR_017706 [Orobanche gracilis]